MCIRCEQKWHNVTNNKYYKLKDYKNDDSICTMQYESDRNKLFNNITANGDESLLKDKKTMKLIKDKGYCPCPQCGTMIEKINGCNHITHKSCQNPIKNGKTHFCYTCGDLLYGTFYNEEKDGKKHFPDGVFYPCYKANINKRNSSWSNNCAIM